MRAFLIRLKQREPGQVVILAVLLLAILIIMVPAMLSLNRAMSEHATASQDKLKGREIAEEGTAWAKTRMAFANKYGCIPDEFVKTTHYPASQGGSFTVDCAEPGVAETALTVTPYNTAGKKIDNATLVSIVTPFTVGVKTPSGLSAPAAVDLGMFPVFPTIPPQPEQLQVELAPLVCRDPTEPTAAGGPALLVGSVQRPRKFALGCISPRISDCSKPKPPTSDQQEYWAFTNPGFRPVINVGQYKQDATNSVCPVVPDCPSCHAGDMDTSFPNKCVYIMNDPKLGRTLIFKNNFVQPVLSASNKATIYVSGANVKIETGATLDSVSAFIVDGNGANVEVTIADTGRPATTSSWNGPGWSSTSYREDPLNSCPANVPNQPCRGKTNRFIDFNGFFYTTGDLTIEAGATQANHWTINGVLRVDGTLTLKENRAAEAPSLLVMYNETVNRQIFTSSFDLKVDTATVVP